MMAQEDSELTYDGETEYTTTYEKIPSEKDLKTS